MIPEAENSNSSEAYFKLLDIIKAIQYWNALALGGRTFSVHRVINSQWDETCRENASSWNGTNFLRLSQLRFYDSVAGILSSCPVLEACQERGYSAGHITKTPFPMIKKQKAALLCGQLQRVEFKGVRKFMSFHFGLILWDLLHLLATLIPTTGISLTHGGKQTLQIKFPISNTFLIVNFQASRMD